MIITWEDTTTTTTNMTGVADAGLVCTGQGNDDGGSRLIIRSFGVYAGAALTTAQLRLYDGATLMATVVSQSSVSSYYEDDMAVVVPPGWTAQVHTTGASSGCTAWAQIELAGGL